MLLRPSNVLLLDEPTNHLDLDSKEVLLDALVDYGGTLIFVSHDRYFVERLATKIIEIGNGTATAFPGTYKEFLWHKEHRGQEGPQTRDPQDGQKGRERQVVRPQPSPRAPESAALLAKQRTRDDKKKADADARRRAREVQARRARIESLESRIAETEATLRDLEAQMSGPGFYEDRATAQPVIDRHQALMWQVGDLMNQWEELQSLSDVTPEA
jgi:ATP-binding cassette subfamily F protein 3